MKIYTKRSFGFAPPAGSDEKSVVTRAMEFAVVPDWVAKTRLFALAVADGNLTVIENAAMAVDMEREANASAPSAGPKSAIGRRNATSAAGA